ncbi:glycoside hydrolase family 3 protein [Agromyces protaetiae]|uniref:Glycoside hydrolase family 3 protein n=1 Tax=Agromyces protaetiae TaxID=2509455 RepID=A0A4P6FR61_9MICO|nr:glycoside hydrolase family 3 N-terminal domain-containing protein [Agromyces protaetiae]QAY73018.1 glycoside hydrolase family 3 protein [Agromyces protaetiae]
MSRTVDRSLRSLVNAVLWPGFIGRTVPGWLRDELDHGLAGVVLFAQNLGDEVERDALAAALHAGRDDVLVGIDEEGGIITRLEARSGSTLPGAWQLGAVDDVVVTEAVGRTLADRSLAAGANVVLGPIADVNVDPANPVIGTRSFGADPTLVSRHVAAEVRGIQARGAAACVKHYPGHGDTSVDSHHDLPKLAIGPDEIERLHLPPFDAAIAAGVDAIMTAHLVVPAWGELPATLNPAILGRLREGGFEGVIVTDALDMAAVRATVGSGRGAVLSLLAGADLLCIGNPANPGVAAAPDQDERDFFEVQHALVAAVASGELDRGVLERAAARVAALAAKVRSAPLAGGEAFGVDDAAGEASAVDASVVVRRAVTVAGALPAFDHGCLVLDARRRSTIAMDSGADYVAAGIARGGAVRRVHLDSADRTTSLADADADADADAAVYEAIAASRLDGRGLVVLLDALAASAGQRRLVDRVAAQRPDAVVVHVGVPSEASAGLALPVIETRGASRVTAEVVADLLSGART